MKIVHVLKREPGPFAERVIEAQARGNEVRVFELFRGFDPHELLLALEEADKVFCW
ncbi:MAG: hypothetical protein M0Z58_03905 [Nitrospiraceae bacterium]|nr:hypothetical protein [Nitrospiraceae bacterium]